MLGCSKECNDDNNDASLTVDTSYICNAKGEVNTDYQAEVYDNICEGKVNAECSYCGEPVIVIDETT